MTRKQRYLLLIATLLSALFIVGLVINRDDAKLKPTVQQQSVETIKPAITTTSLVPSPTPVPAPTPTLKERKDALKDQWKNFGVSGSNFRIDPGSIGGGEGELLSLKTFRGNVYSIDFEPNHFEQSLPLDKRLVYLVQIDRNSSEGVLCGAALPDFRKAPARCIAHQKILSFREVKNFFRGKIKEHDALFAEIESFLRKRTG